MNNNCHFITAKFDRYDKFTDLNLPCYRIMTNKDTFYCFASQFDNLHVLDRLKEGDIIHQGSHALTDGTTISPELVIEYHRKTS